MQPIEARELVKAISGEISPDELHVKITGVSTDTRTLQPGDLFFALTGTGSDGHKFLADALMKGASGVVVSKRVEAKALTLRVEDTLVALGQLAAYYRSKFSPVVIGVTGSVGKTTTKEMIAAVCSANGPVLKNEGNFNNEIGLPLTLFNLAPEHKTCVVEMAMRGPDQISYLAKIANCSIGVITNVHMSHIELLGSMDAIARAKGELLDYLPEDGTAVINADDAYFEAFTKRAKSKVLSFGESAHADIRAVSCGLDSMGCCRFDVITPRGSFEVRVPVPGEHNIKDALAAIAVGEILEIEHDAVRNALARFKAPEKRSAVVPSRHGYMIIDDTYNAAPMSMTSALKTLKMMEGERKIAVLGDMLELGELERDVHVDMGKFVKELGIDKLVVVGDLGKLISRGAIDAGMPISSVLEFEDSTQVAKELAGMLKERDVVLVKGSRAMKMERIVEGLVAS